MTQPPSLLRRIPGPVKAAFACCFVGCYVAHLYAFTNIIPNADGLSRVWDTQQMTIAGRWFLHYATVFNGFVQAPAVIGFFTALFLSLSAGLTLSLLEVKSPLLGGLVGMLMGVFPPVAFTLLFLFTSSAYSFGILLAVLAVWLANRSPKLLPPAVLALACALGTYQAYGAVAAALALCRLLCYALEENRKPREVLRLALRFLALLVLGLAFYYLELRLFLRVKNLSLMDYQKISSLGELELLGQMLSRLGRAYTDFTPTQASPLALGTCLGLLGIGLLSLVRRALRVRLQERPGTLLLTLLFLALLPLALNLPVLMVRRVRTHMRYALVFGPVLALALTDLARRREAPPPSSRQAPHSPTAGRALEPLTGLVVALSLLLGAYSFNLDNLAYTASATAHRATESYLTRLVTRVEPLPGYQEGMEVVIVGSLPEERDDAGVAAFRDLDAPSYSVLNGNKHIYYYLNDWLNVPWPEPKAAIFEALTETALFRDMPLYPEEGSLQILEGRVLVKLSERYVPRLPYEEQYEERR